MATISAAATKRYAELKVKQATGPLTVKEAAELDTITLALHRPAKRKASSTPKAAPAAGKAAAPTKSRKKTS